MRALDLRFRGVFRGGDTKPLDIWLDEATSSGIDGMRQFAMTIRRDIAVMRNAICEPWSND
jgi:transposase